MDLEFIENIVFEDKDFTEDALAKAEYYGCTFNRCNLAKADLSLFLFDQCTFRNCDLTAMKLRDCSFSEGKFTECKMIGVDFTVVNNMSFNMEWESCILDFSLFSTMRLQKIHFKSCHMEEVDFSETDLTSAIFEECRLPRAVFESANLSKANFQSASDFTIDPDNNQMRGAIFSKENANILLRKYRLDIR